MAAPKKRNARPTARRGHDPAEEREKRDQYAAVLENLHSDFKVFGEALEGVETRLQAGLDDLRRELHTGLARIEVALDKKVDRDEVQAMIARGIAGR